MSECELVEWIRNVYFDPIHVDGSFLLIKNKYIKTNNDKILLNIVT